MVDIVALAKEGLHWILIIGNCFYTICSILVIITNLVHEHLIFFRTCSDIDECEKFKDRGLCIGQCNNVPGSYACSCPEGYRVGSDGRTCQGIIFIKFLW